MSTREKARFGRATVGIAAAGVLVLTPGAYAQDASTRDVIVAQADGNATEGDPLVLPSLNVGAGQENANGPVNGYVAGRSATATKTDTPINEVPQSITVLCTSVTRSGASLPVRDVGGSPGK